MTNANTAPTASCPVRYRPGRDRFAVDHARGFTGVRAAAAHARATSRETIGVAGVRGVEANFALMPLTQRRQRSVSW